jgi:hypothetical protein
MVARNFEAPDDADANNSYVVGIIATDDDGNEAKTDWVVNVQDDPADNIPSATASTIEVNYPVLAPTGAVAGSVNPATNTNIVIVTVRNADGDPLANHTVNIGLDAATIGSATIESTTPAATDSNGQVRFDLTDYKAEDFDVEFFVGLEKAADTVNVVFTVGPETDSDLDGVPDLVENAEGTDADDSNDFIDSDNDGTPDYLEPDADNDGRSNTDESAGIDPYADADNDGIPNYLDVDDRGDGVAAVCTDVVAPVGACDIGAPDYPALDPLFDLDQDGVANHIDPDTDGDGVLDRYEVAEGTDHVDAND